MANPPPSSQYMAKQIHILQKIAQTSNEIILQSENETKTLIKDIRKRQSHLLGHIIRKEHNKHTVITGNISEKRDRG